MRKFALALAILSYVIPAAAQAWLRVPPGETGHGMFWLVMTVWSLVFSGLFSGLATALAIAALRDEPAGISNPVATHWPKLAFMAAPAILVISLGVAIALWAAA